VLKGLWRVISSLENINSTYLCLASAEGFMARFGDLIPKVLMPVVTFIFSLGYWWYGLSHYFTEEDKL